MTAIKRFRNRWLRRRIWRWRWNRFMYRRNPDPEYEAWIDKERAEAQALIDSLAENE